MKETIMHPRHGYEDDDEMAGINRLTALAAVLLLLLLVVVTMKFELWQVPEDYSAVILLDNGSVPQPMATVARHD
jgi:hypothetical protein